MSVNPPRPKGPPLNALRAFESAARLRSFTAAAEELCVTPGAIAQHIKSLESWAEAPLFHRHSRGVSLTPLGENLLPEFTDAFDRLSEAVQSLRTKAASDRIRIAALPSIAQLWLPERLGALRRHAPEFAVSVSAVETPPNLSREPVDISLFFEDIQTPTDGLTILQDSIYPVAAPHIAERLTSLACLGQEVLLHDSAWPMDWDNWLSAIPGGEKIPRKGPIHSLYAVAMEEARHGAGVLMGHDALVRHAVRKGDLVRPFPQALPLQRWLVLRTTSAFAKTPGFALLTSVFHG